MIETDSELHELVANNDVVVVDFSAPGWCIPCRRLVPHFNTAADKLTEVTFVEVDIDKSEDIKKAYDIMSVPYLVAFKGGKVVGEVKSRTAVSLVEEIRNIVKS
jgi:thiol-disulfide isomerase/thioredoxin